MYWEEKNPHQRFVVPDDIVDVAFSISCRCLPLDHAYGLSQAILNVLPLFKEEEDAGIHLIHGAESGNGWYRPEDPDTELLQLSRRTKMTLRVPGQRLGETLALQGTTLDVSGFELTVGEGTVRPLSSLGTLFSRYVIDQQNANEQTFLAAAVDELGALGLDIHKILCGRAHPIRTPDGPIHTRSLMIAELPPEQSVKLQQKGLGPGRTMGCGLFLPHKGIAPVKQEDGA